MIRRPGRRPASDVRQVSVGWTAGGEPWLRHASAAPAEATAAIGAYAEGTVLAQRYRGRAGQPKAVQEARYERLSGAGSLEVSALALAGLLA